SDGSLTVQAPPHTAGTVPVTVHSPYGTSTATAADQFTFGVPTPQPGQFQFSASAYSAGENGGSVTVTVTRTGGSLGAVGVAYATSDGTATAGKDYTTATGTLNWADGETAS